MTDKPTIVATSYLDWSTRGRSAVWWYAIAIMAAYLIWIMGGVPAVLLFPAAIADERFRVVTTAWGFLPGLIAVLLAVRLVLGRPAYSVLAPARPLRWSDYLVGVGIGYAVQFSLMLLALPFMPVHYQGFGEEARLGLGIILLIITGLMVQTAFEELFFRGLIMQFAWRIKAWLPFALAVQALLFALPHFGNVAAMSQLGMVSVLPYALIGACWGWVGWRTGSLLVPMGLHFANNSFLTLIAGSKGDVLKPYGPLVEDMTPSFGQALIGISLQAIFTVLAVEAWMRWRQRSKQPLKTLL